ncbi:hypothetical protein CO165_01080 [Candidatus Roizmanbacteria bacterium CG_4_9_14_3_um_filter_33_18]|uniref:Uncharacterized protein n=1 Tax=Candidatus Roizmanbacteria bacterium CG_4_9_14_3_um_filter_33_18 TaxID=1974841 RepID=A0A2M7XYV2_9BACT|nr:MAG: hypothetical protein CO165_01080 [Candidatus Roizmanbacteria bacterium CG_4_9_14_3_um_filter_33_18]
MKKLKNISLTYSTVFVLFSIFFLLLFHSPLFTNETVLFYRGISLLSVTTLVFLPLIFLTYFKLPKVNIESLMAAIIVSAAIHLSLFIIFPVTFERSVTMYILTSLQNSQPSSMCSGLTKNQVQELLINDYIVKKKAVDKRMQEQGVINFIKIKEDCISVTPKATNFIYFSEFVKKLYNID